MPRLLPSNDFRARRHILVRGDFALATGRAQRPSDLIERSTWDGIVTLPDDVAVRTSNHHGTTLRQLEELWGAWVECYGSTKDCMFPVMLDAADDFQAATYAALTGYYRLSVAALRSSLELVTIGAWAQVCGKRKEFKNWRAGKLTLSLGLACDGLISGTELLRAHLRSVANDSLFDQKDALHEGGFVRRIYSGVSDFAHSRPGYADADLRKSNGPIYVRSAFNHVAWVQFETIGLCFLLVLLARPGMRVPPVVVDLFADVKRVRSRVTRAAFQSLYVLAP